MQECIIRKGYHIKRKFSYYRLIEQLVLRDDPTWVPVDSKTAPVGKSFKETLEMTKCRDQCDIPLLFTDLTWESNNTTTYIREFLEDEVDNSQDVTSPKEKRHMRAIPSCSVIRNAIPGYQLMNDKYLLAKTLIGSPYSVPSVFIDSGKRIFNPLNIDISSKEQEKEKQQSGIWYLKDPLLNKSLGIQLFSNIEDVLENCSSEKRYLLQKEIIPLLLNEKYKFDVRVMVVLYFNKDETKLYLFKDGVVRSTQKQYECNSLDKSSQLTNFCYQLELDPEFKNIYSLSEIDSQYNQHFYNSIKVAVTDIFSRFIHKLNQMSPRNQGFTVWGLDFIFDQQTKSPHLLEMNLSPSMFQKSKPEIAEICQRFSKQLVPLFLDPLVNQQPQPTDTLDFVLLLSTKNTQNNTDNDNIDSENDILF
ncbi:hypothetical protein DLAC_09458 [Tieghemostelium lacteum]|uniref:Tubulin--tyrosine ligase n=1 Tax=Tieghemostelium lacteum TaxID=361077 RepID=A0A151Z7F6_TIELA|nr:hypothetical protein DLAC_09458 [Tieghemostelium lacteum]|eukprot:KYQ89891.1 hypothetical protein DLAC_09458 [Tieghemostelium lacteum]